MLVTIKVKALVSRALHPSLDHLLDRESCNLCFYHGHSFFV